ncbi:MAG: PLP-dependent aminotransferase family protein [Peptostreptococcaceae bacterium]|nr:PLP-dependent aminotransferase family protein [Peptostreptococcaceae bacterium]
MKYANRMGKLKASEIRELLKLTTKPEIISFAGGLPAPEMFPVEQIKAIVTKIMDEQGETALQYSPTEGYAPLREAICGMNDFDSTVDDVLITSGSQQGLDFSAKIFINPGDVIICESPSYLGALNAFKAYEADFREVGMDEDGMIMEDLEKVLKETPRARMIYVIPDFQNPTGRTWTVERRKRFMELANEYDLPVIEDNPYGALRFEGVKPPSLKSFDTEGRVIFLGTFSKTFCPGLRIGWVQASEEILNKYILVKQGADLQTNSLAQREIYEFVTNYDFAGHVEHIKNVYRGRRDLMLESIEKYFPKEAKHTYPEGGLFLWITLPERINTKELSYKALEKNVAYVPGGSFYPNGDKQNSFRLNYSYNTDDKIVEGIKRLGEVITEAMKA